jgi:cyanuric acid amidohydrolase
MPRLALHRLPMAHPADLSALEALLREGRLSAADIRAVIGKTEGNGGLNDFTRGYFTQSLMLLLGRHTGENPEALAARVPCVLSGGTEGVLSPHYTVFAAAPGAGRGRAASRSAPPSARPRPRGRSAAGRRSRRWPRPCARRWRRPAWRRPPTSRWCR